jgi:isopenicillin-N N-acyltransferase like protein
MFRAVTVSGSPHARGVQHGRAARRAVRTNCEVTYARMLACHQLDRRALRHLCAPLYASLVSHMPDIAEEIEGVAAGARLNRDDVIVLNCFPDVALDPRCTTAIVRDAEGSPLLFQNNDAFAAYRETIIVLHVVGDPSLTMVTYAGMVGESGINSHGLAVAGNSLPTAQDPHGVPFAALMRRVLEQETVGDAVTLLESVPRACGMAYVLVDGHGDATFFETSPAATAALPSDERRAHTNHCIADAVRAHEHTPATPLRRSIDRLAAAEDVLAAGAADGLELLMRLARDHDHGPESVCQHPRLHQDHHTAWQTLYGMLADPVGRELHVADGTPCTHEFRPVQLPWAVANTPVTPRSEGG